ncbi:MAG: Nif11-like leader peptide family natural product precursor [Prochloraceae cyanobacterium]|nr:Nif11-like leader peptide family natural product precursor [Prochloraceae cyanobacterium]
MSAEAVNQFLDLASKNEQLAQEIAKAMEAENDRQAVTDLAVSKGYQFTSDELWAEIQKRQADFQKRQDAGQLTEEELEAVAGGATPLITAIPIVSAAVSGVSSYISVDQAVNKKW